MVFRKYRDHLRSNCERGGGVFIAVKRNNPVELLTIADNNIQHIFVKIIYLEGDIAMRCVYIPPLSAIDTYDNRVNNIIHKG